LREVDSNLLMFDCGQAWHGWFSAL